MYRLNGFTIQLPPLRERMADIPMLAAHFLRRFNRELNRTAQSIAPDALDALLSHNWPGNIRELENAIRYALVQSTGLVVTRENLPPSCQGAESPLSTRSGHVAVASDLVGFVRQQLQEGTRNLYRSIGQEVDRIVLTEALAHFEGNLLQTADRLGISRVTLRTKLRTLGLIDAGHGDETPVDGEEVV